MTTLNDSNIVKKTVNNKNLFKAILVLIMIFVVCTGIGRYMESPFSAKITFAEPELIEDSTSKVVIDNDRTRLTFLNAEGEVYDVESKGILQTQVTKYQEALINGDYVYIHVINYNTDSVYIQSEEINCYDRQGNQINNVYTAEYQSIDKNVVSARIKGMVPIKQGISFVKADLSRGTLQAFKYASGKTILDKEAKADIDVDSVYKAKYNQTNGIFGVISVYGDVYTYQAGAWQNRNAPDSFEKIPADITINDNGTVTFISEDQLSVKSIESAPYSAFYLFNVWTYWLSRAILILVVIIVGIRYLIDNIKKGRGQQLVKAGIAFVAIFGIASISGYYSSIITQDALNFREIQVKSISASVSELSSKYISDNIEEINEMDEGAQAEIKNMMAFARRISILNANSGVNLHCNLYKKFNNGKWIMLAESCSDEKVKIVNHKSTDIDASILNRVSKGAQIVTNHREEDSNAISAFSPIINAKGAVVGMIEISSNLHLINLSQKTEGIEWFVLLLVGLIGLYFVASEIIGAAKGWKEKNKLKREKNPTPDIAMYRTFMFLGNFLICFDMAVSVLFTKDIINSSGGRPSPFVLALPSTFVVFGQIFGQFLCNRFRSKVRFRPFLIGTSIYTIIFLILTSYAVTQGSIALYFASLFFTNIGCNALYNITVMMPYNISNERKRLKLFGDFGLSEISGPMLGIAVAGNCADFLGNYAVYIMAIIPVIAYMILGIKVLTEKTFKATPKAEITMANTNIKTFKFFVSPGMIALVLFLVVPSGLIGAFKSYAFPILASAQGMTNGYISDFVVIASCIAFLMNGPFLEFLSKADHWRVVIFEVFAMGLVLLIFYFNTTIVWAVLVVVLFTIINKFIKISINMLFPRLAREAGVPERKVKSYILYIDGIVNLLRTFVWAGLLSFGLKLGCMIFGGIIIIGILFFALITKRLAIRKELSHAAN